MAKVYFETNDTQYIVVNDDTKIFGTGADDENAILYTGAKGLVVDSTLERVDFAGNIGDFLFKQSFGSNIEVQNTDGNVIATIADVTGKEMAFGDGTVVLGYTDGTVSVGGTDITSEASFVIPADIDATDISASDIADEDSDTSGQALYVGADHDTFPYSAVVYITSTFPSGITYRGSGAVVGKNDVLTASHVVYSVNDGGMADEIRVYPGRDGASIPLGPYDGGYIDYFKVDPDGDGILSQQDSEDDLAIIGFDLSIGTFTGWFGLDPDGPSGYYNATGYPGVYDDNTGPRMVNSNGLATKSDRYQIFNYDTIETHPGSSGGPLWYTSGTSPYIAGISSTSGWAADIASHYNSILDWIAGNDFLLDRTADAALHGTAEHAEVELLGVPASDAVLIV